MKKFLFTVMISCAIFVQGFSQDANEKEENPNAPEITFEEVIHDFGNIPFKENAEYEFTFTNTGKEPLIIQNCSTTCGCTSPTCPKNKPIKPGEKSSIKVKYVNTHLPGSFNRDITVQSNAKNASVKITIKGVVEQKTEVVATK